MKQGQQVLWADEDAMRLRKPEGVGRSSLGSSVTFVLLPGTGRRCRGRNLTRGANGSALDFGRARDRRPLGERRTLKEGGSSREETWSFFRDWLGAGRVKTL